MGAIEEERMRPARWGGGFAVDVVYWAGALVA